MNRECRAEAARWFVLAAVAWWLLGAFVTERQIGAGDALWYAQMLADFVTQWRLGEFPVFVGQTEYAFNGAVYPLRVAPAYQHLGGILDLVTARQLGFFTLQHLVAVFCGVAALVLTYLTATWIAPNARWIALGLAILLASCPGVLGLVATQDLYMSWVAMPGIPIAMYGTVRAWTHDDGRAAIAVGAGVAWLWLAHAPIALWATAVVGVLQLIRLLARDRNLSAWLRAGGAGALAVALGHYPFVSLRLLGVEGGPATSGALPRAETILDSLHQAFPQTLFPLTLRAQHLGDLQLGYGLWLVLAVVVAGAIARRRWWVLAIGGMTAALLVVLFPIPGISRMFWLNLPDAVQRLTYYWPMQRIIPVAAGLIVMGGAALCRDVVGTSLRWRSIVQSLLLIACLWSLWEARQFRAAVEARTSTSEASRLRLRPENLMLMNHAYGLYPALPPTFSHGVMDPTAEFRLLARETFEPLEEPSGVTDELTGVFRGNLDANPGILNLEPRLRIEPGKRYQLTFEFLEHDYVGVLQILGDGFFREYLLPHSGEPHAFGSASSASPTLPIWTTNSDPTNLQLRFIPTSAGVSPLAFDPFARFRLSAADPETARTTVMSLVPPRVRVQASEPAWLETPRMYLPHYVATTNDRATAVRAGPGGLTMVPVAAGTSIVALEYRPPPLLRLSYFATASAWLALVGIVLVRRRGPRPST